MKLFKWFDCFAALSLLIPGGGFCAEQPAGTVRLDAVVVSATRSEISVFDVPQSVTVVTREEIAASAFERVEDIVRSVPGIYNFRHFGLHTNGIVSPLKMRGVGNNRILVLVDGVPQNDNFNNAIAWVAWGHIPKDSIERIEIVRGPNSALYGSEGLGGVIHIITRTPGDARQTSIRAEAGTADTYGIHGFHSGNVRNFSFLLAGGYEESDGFYMTESPQGEDIKRYREVRKALGKTTYDLGRAGDIALAALCFNQDAGQGRTYFHNDLQLDQYWLNYTSAGSFLGLKGLLYLNRVDKTAHQDSTADNYAAPFRNEKFKGTYTWGADLQSTLLNLHAMQLTFGAAYKQVHWQYDEDYAGSTRDAGAEGKQRFISPFAGIDLRLLNESLIVHLGARYDWIETLDGANWDSAASAGRAACANQYSTHMDKSFSPKLGIAWHPDDRTTLRASGGKGFRAPSLFERYKVHVRGGGTSYREANPDLGPEEIWSCDAGAERFVQDNVWARVTFYRSFAKDYIGERLLGTAPVADGRTRFDYRLDNITEVDIYGIETELEWFPSNDFTLFANYTCNISKVRKDKNDAALKGNYLPHEPRHNSHFGFRYVNPDIINVSVTANYYADIYYDNENTIKTGDYWTLDVGLSRRFFERLTVYVNAENIFDKRYPIFRSLSSGDTIAPGLIVLGGMKLDL